MIVQTFDSPGDDAGFVSYVQVDKDESVGSGSFVFIDDSESAVTFFGEIVSPPLNINFTSNSTGPIALHQIKNIAEDKYKKEILIDDTRLYKIRLLSMSSNGKTGSIRLRPRTASKARLATEHEILEHLRLPEGGHEIGSLISMLTIPIGVTGRTFLHHIGVAGSTGSGKTNTIANFMVAAQSRDTPACVIVFDHKPDYSDCNKAIDGQRGLNDVSFYTLEGGARGLSIEACDLEPSVLAGCVFYRHSEENQKEAFETMIEVFSREQENSKGESRWTWNGFKTWLTGQEHGPYKINKRTWDAMIGKFNRTARRPSFINSGKSLGKQPIDLDEMLKSNSAHVFNVSGGNGRHYALFMSYVLGQIATKKAESADKLPPVVFIVDEAQDIFNSSKDGTAILGEHIRKGRSLQMGFVIGVQSSSAIPTEIRNNLNSMFLMKHLNPSQAKEAVHTLTQEQLEMVRSFGPGECFAYLHGASTTVHAQMNLSPFELTKPKEEWV